MNYNVQPKEAPTGEELLALIPTPTNANTERIEFIDRTQRFIDAHAGELGRFFWGVEVTDKQPRTELGFVPAIAE
jgi:hypothetical protein